MPRRSVFSLLAFWISIGFLPMVAIPAKNGTAEDGSSSASSLCILVMDPLAKELACDCLAGFAQRRYEALAMVLQRRLERPCASVCGTKLATYWNEESPVHLIIGKHSDVLYQAKQLGRKVFPIASLTNAQGETTFQGLFVVRRGNPAQSLADLDGYRILFGPAGCDEKHVAALVALRKAGVQGFDGDNSETVETCTDAANHLMNLADNKKAAAVISDYARVLLEGCETIPPGSLRVIGKTDSIPFITVFATGDMSHELRDEVKRALLDANRFSALRKLLETKDGFKAFVPADERMGRRTRWPDFRGPQRDALVPALPDTLDQMRTAWTAPLEENGLGGVAATERWVVATDRDPARDGDCLKVFDAHTGSCVLVANLERPPGSKPDREIDFGKSIRATPVIHDGRVFVLDAFGTLFVCDLPDRVLSSHERTVVGMRTESLVDQFKLATWGVGSTPLIVEDKLFVNVCGAESSLLALELDSLKPAWKGPGQGTGYASCIAGRFGGRRQIVGYQSESLSGWGLDSGTLLWNLRPEVDGDYNVPSPVAIDGRHLLVATENNAMRLYEFDDQGILASKPVAVNEDVSPDTVTPIAVNGFVYCTSGDELFRLDLGDGLKSDWSKRDQAFMGHVSLIADTGGQRLLVATYSGELLLFDISESSPELTSRRKPFGLAVEEEIYSHPALVGNRLYLRGTNSLSCIVF